MLNSVIGLATSYHPSWLVRISEQSTLLLADAEDPSRSGYPSGAVFS
jgi:hypothetical protein